MDKKIVDNKTRWVVSSQLLHPAMAKYLIVIVDRGMTSEVNYFNSLKEAKRGFKKIAHNHRYRPSEINSSDKYDVSIWEVIDSKYEKVYGY